MRSATLGLLLSLLASGAAIAQTRQTYSYDALGRLVASATAEGPQRGSLTRYSLDPGGNRVQLAQSPIVTRATQDELRSGESLLPTQVLRSQDNRFTLELRTDGNLEIVGPGNTQLWTSATYGSEAVVLTMQSDGNLGLRTPAYTAVWYTRTHNYPGAYLKMQSDGNLVIFSGTTPVWSTGTGGH